jgi:hypothetical protein
VAIDPDDPHIMYFETQQGNLYRHDRSSEEALSIQPQPAPGDEPERWNWDSPLLISPHSPARLYFGSQRLWRSEDRGNSWTPISGDLTTNRNRYELELMERVWSVNALYHNGAMSKYATLTAITESPITEGVLYTGSDDGLIQVSEDGGQTWRVAGGLPGVPPLSFVNDLEASQHDANTVFAIADAHKTGDFSPYVFQSTDRGRSWRSIAGDLPAGTIVWSIQQDHENAALLFVGAEYGVYFTANGGTNWHKVNGAPTIAFRDIKLQRRDDDLVGATFGRGFYVLDDYTPLRGMAAGALANGSTLFPVRDAWWYIPLVPMQARGQPTLGSTAYTAPNPPFGATFTYYLADAPETEREARRNVERQLRQSGEDVQFPGYDQLRREVLEGAPKVLLRVSDDRGQPVRWVEGPAKTGLHRVSWDLRRPAPDPVEFPSGGFVPPWAGQSQGPLAAPGQYQVELFLLSRAGLQSLSTPQEFTVKPVPTAPTSTDFAVVAAFQLETSELMRRVSGASEELGNARERLRYMRAALVETPSADPELFSRIDELTAALAGLRLRLNGDQARSQLWESTVPSIMNRVGRVTGHWDTRQMPTATYRRNLEIARGDFAVLRSELTSFIETDLAQLESDLEAAGAPWTPGRRIPSR